MAKTLNHTELYELGSKLRDQLEKMTLSDLLKLNPTLEDIRHIQHVLAIGYGEGADSWHVECVEKMMESRTRER